MLILSIWWLEYWTNTNGSKAKNSLTQNIILKTSKMKPISHEVGFGYAV